MKDREHQEQVAFFNWFKFVHPTKLAFAIPNGGKRNITVAKKLKAEGALSGVPDIMIASANGVYHGMFIEMKAGKNKPTESQIKVMEQLKAEGYKVEVCYSWAAAGDLVTKYLNAANVA